MYLPWIGASVSIEQAMRATVKIRGARNRGVCEKRRQPKLAKTCPIRDDGKKGAVADGWGATMICTKCGYTEDADGVYCSSCGALLGSAPESGPQVALPVSGGAQSGPQVAPPASGAAHPAPGAGQATASGGLTGGPTGAPAWSAHSSTPHYQSSSVYGVFVIILGGICFLIALILQFAKVSADGASLSASQVNEVCQSGLGQFGQAVSGVFGDSQTQSICSTAATIEDWKGITFWFGLAFVLSGAGLIARSRSGWLRSSTASYAASQQSPAAKLAAAERAEANAARLRAQAAQLQGQRAASSAQQRQVPVQQPPAAGGEPPVPGPQPPAPGPQPPVPGPQPPTQGLARPQAGFDAAEP